MIPGSTFDRPSSSFQEGPRNGGYCVDWGNWEATMKR
jgi:hypothetical protein